MLSTWDESWETGNEMIDSHHRNAVALSDELKAITDGPPAEVLRVLDQLMEFTWVHFLAEENLMDEVDYPSAAARAMHDQHEQFKSYARLRVLEFRQGPTQSVLPLQSYVEGFLKIHEFGMDLLLADWIREQNVGPPPR